jgi:NTE family protein
MSDTTHNGVPLVRDDGERSPEPADGLARPVDFKARRGAGTDRALVLGGGGIFFIAWQVGYLTGLRKRGVDLTDAQLIVGTSAGALVGSIVSAGKLPLFSREVGVLGKLAGVLAPTTDLRPSQERALRVFAEATDASAETVRRIGHAALAARGLPATRFRRSVRLALAPGGRRWPAPSLNIVTVDAYTGERLVVTHRAGVSAVAAAAASASVPGLFDPQPIRDRRCMDGGVSGSGTHGDLVAGAGRAVIIALGASLPQEAALMTMQPGSLDKEMEALAAAGTETLVRGPRAVDPATLMSSKAVPGALAMAEEQAEEDAAAVGEFWREPAATAARVRSSDS